MATEPFGQYGDAVYGDGGSYTTPNNCQVVGIITECQGRFWKSMMTPSFGGGTSYHNSFDKARKRIESAFDGRSLPVRQIGDTPRRWELYKLAADCGGLLQEGGYGGN